MSFLPPYLQSQPAPAAPNTSAAQANIAQYDLAFQISPIILQGGIAASVQGKMIPISSLIGGLSSPSASGAIATANAHPGQLVTVGAYEPLVRFLPAPGSTLISQAIGGYPFANQVVAANATMQQPLNVSLLMIAPVNQAGGYLSKLHVFTALQNALQQHNAAEGTYIVATPAFIYTDMILLQMVDVSPEIGIDSPQAQIHYQLDFSKPVLTKQDAQRVQNNTMSKISSGGQISSLSWSGQLSSNPATETGNAAAAISLFGGSLE